MEDFRILYGFIFNYILFLSSLKIIPLLFYLLQWFYFSFSVLCVHLGFLEKEVKKDGIPMLDTGDNPDAPAPREMTDLEVLSQGKLTFWHL